MHKIGVPRLRIGESEQKGMAVSVIEAFWAGVFAPFKIVYSGDEFFQLREPANNLGDGRRALIFPKSEENHVAQCH